MKTCAVLLLLVAAVSARVAQWNYDSGSPNRQGSPNHLGGGPSKGKPSQGRPDQFVHSNQNNEVSPLFAQLYKEELERLSAQQAAASVQDTVEETAAAEESAAATSEESATATAEESATATAEESSTATSEESATSTAEESATTTAEESSTATAEESSTTTAEESATTTAEESSTATAEESSTATAEESSTATAEESTTTTAEESTTTTAEESTTTTAEESTSDETSSTDSSDDFADEMLEVHNEYRTTHQAPALTYDSDIATFAQEWADYLASTGTLEHRTDNSYGENIYWTSASTATAKAAVAAWYSEVTDYTDYTTDPYDNGGSDFVSGHFTQVVWVSSEKLGCGKATGSTGTIVVCNYSPAGNYVGQFVANVLPAQ